MTILTCLLDSQEPLFIIFGSFPMDSEEFRDEQYEYLTFVQHINR